MKALAAAAIVGVSCAPAVAPSPPLDFAARRPAGTLAGAWVGGTNVLGGNAIVEVDFRRAGDRLTGEMRIPTENVSRLPLMDVESSDTAVRFTIRSPLGVHRATGRWDDGMIFGRIEGGGVAGDFHLLPVHDAEPDENRRRAGLYTERPSPRLLVVARGGGRLAWSETQTLDDGALRIAGGHLYGYAGDTMFSDRSIRADPRQLEWAVFHGDSAIEWHPEERPVRLTSRVEGGIAQEAVTFANGDVRLSGTLLLPPGAGPHPAVVLVHGSGPVERASLGNLLRAELLLREGIAVLLYDKRGAGTSSGSWETAGIEELADDAAAGVALLRTHPKIARGAVGLFGHSQAGWVIPAAARRASGADFLIVLSGGAVSAAEQELFRARAEATAAGLSAGAAAALMARKWEYARTGRGWEEYIAAVRAAAPGVVRLVEAPADTNPELWALTRALARYEPLVDLRAIGVPTFVAFGSEDDNVPVDRAAELWRDAVGGSLDLHVIPGVGHSLIGVREGTGSIFPATLVRALNEWVKARR